MTTESKIVNELAESFAYKGYSVEDAAYYMSGRFDYETCIKVMLEMKKAK